MPASPLTFQDLKSDLWNCAQILRGSAIDRTDWKGYILPLLFFKRISDVWDEETADAREEYGDIDLGVFPEQHRFTLPDGCHWRDVRETPASVGTALALPVPHNFSLDFMKPLRYCSQRGGAESGWAQPAGRPRPTARRAGRGGLARR